MVQVPVGQSLLLIEDKLLQLHLHLCAGHRTWRRRKHRQVTYWSLGPGSGGWPRGSLPDRERRCADGPRVLIQDVADAVTASQRKEKDGRSFNKRPSSHEDFT